MIQLLTPYAGAVVLLLAFLVGMAVSFLLYRHFLTLSLDRRMGKTKFNSSSSDLEALKELNKNLEANTRALQAKELELTMANKRLEKLEEAKSKFVAVTTHQLRTPLAAIKWTINMLAAGQLGPVTDEQKTFIDKAYKSTERVIAIVNDLLHVDNIEAETADFTFVPVQLEEVIDSIMFEFTAPAQSKYLDLKFERPEKKLPEMAADPIKLRMVFENLIDNAIKYTPQHGRVTVTIDDGRLNATPRSVLIKIADTGVGIKPEDEKKIFQKFFRGGNAVSMEPDGSGLGLYITRDIIEKHGGTIWFETGPTGTTFFLSLPLDRPVV